MQEDLLGYLLGALDVDEQETIKRQIDCDPNLQQQLTQLQTRLAPLEASRMQYEPPAGLAARTCQAMIDAGVDASPQPLPMSPATDAPSSTHRWTLLDVVVAMGMCVAAACLFLPPIAGSRYRAQLTQCQSNLRHIGQAMSEFSERFDGYFPQIPAAGNWSAAGFVAPRLKETGLIRDDRYFLCPGSELNNQRQTFIIPMPEEIRKASGVKLLVMRSKMGGSYGYNMGYVSHGRLQPIRDQGRSRFALISDAPVLHPTKGFTANHGGNTFNTLFEDGSVRKLTSPIVGADHIFRSERGMIEPGMHQNDAVVAHSSSRPRIVISFRYRTRQTEELLPESDLTLPEGLELPPNEL